MYSMTGFGRGEYSENGLDIWVELKSVNNRFLDLSLKTPHLLSPFEEKIRETLRTHLSRGHVEAFVGFLDKREKGKQFYVDHAAASAYFNAYTELKERFPALSDDLTLSGLLRAPDVLTQEEEKTPDEAFEKGVEKALLLAVENLKAMRKREGERLKEDILVRLKCIEELRTEISARAPLVSENYQKKLLDRMNEYLEGKADESRILTEAALFADKCNIDEELTRLESHIAQFYKICTEELVGRKLDFLVQEFNRECNTICSKSNDVLLTKSALAMKNEIEKIREQIQNLE